ncbi:MAG: hypothetical protein KAW47_10005 [Thermoplasmatales archaeon]|nr:hypothetical protein [Thermoplasmatales archaeon]
MITSTKKKIGMIFLITIFMISSFSTGVIMDSDIFFKDLKGDVSESTITDNDFEKLPYGENEKEMNYFEHIDFGGLPMDYFAETGDTGGRVFHLWDLASAKPENFQKIFSKSIDPDVLNFRGNNFSGIVLFIKNLYLGKLIFTAYTGKISDALIGRTYSQALTFQKRFYPDDNSNGESGINYWPVRGKESMAMKIYLSPSIENDTINSLKIDYDVVSNKKITQRPLIDEVRQIPDSNLYIGKMYYRLAGKHVLFLWFAIELENYVT